MILYNDYYILTRPIACLYNANMFIYKVRWDQHKLKEIGLEVMFNIQRGSMCRVILCIFVEKYHLVNGKDVYCTAGVLRIECIKGKCRIT